MLPLADAVRGFCAAQGLPGTPGVVGVSGGPDSVALLLAMADAGAGPLTVAHVNHALRGAESDADEAFVRDLCGRLGVACRVRRADAAAAGGNVEAAGRRARYAWFAEVAAAVGSRWAATGHTADDQAETVLHRLVRGAGVRGLRGVAAVRSAGRLRVVRPLLAVTRADVLDSLASAGQPYRTDASNADPAFTRNRVRHELLPLLRTFNPAVVDVLGRLAEQATDAHAALDRFARDLLAATERPRAGRTLVFDPEVFGGAPPYLAAEVFRLVWEREGWAANGMTYHHWRRLAALTPGDYPGGVRLARAGRVVRLGPRS